MGKLYDAIDDELSSFLRAQRVFFVATAPSTAGHVNLSPKGYDALRVLGPHDVAYLDYPGSGVETIAHLRENGRIVLMVCAFEGPPKIVRLYGTGRAVEPDEAEFAKLLPRFEPRTTPRSIIAVRVQRIADSCGYSVPLYDYKGEREQLVKWTDRKQRDGALEQYLVDKNSSSIDGLPGLARLERERRG